MTLIDIDKFLASFITEMKECSQMRNFSIPRCIKKALDDQGLEYKDGEIVKSQRRVSAEAKEDGYGESEDELTWLTKYIEEEAYSLSMDIRDNEDRIKLKKLQKALAWLEKQGQKPVIEMKTPEESLGIDSETYNKIVDECIYGEQKLTWSEEDEKMKDLIISVLEVNHSKGIFKAGLRDIRTEEIVSWLKSIKNRIKGE